MAVTASQLETSNNDNSLSSYSTGSVTPTSNDLVLVGVFSRSSSTARNQPTITGNGLTYVHIATVVETGTGIQGCSLFRALGASPSAGALTIDFAGQAQARCYWSITDFGNVDTTGTNGSGAVVQSATNKDEVAPSSLTVTLGAFGSVNNATYGFMRGGPSITPGTGFTELGEVNAATNIEAEWQVGNDTTVDWTFTGDGSSAFGIAVEIKQAGAVVASANNLSLLNAG